MTASSQRRQSPKRSMITLSLMGIAVAMLSSTSQPALADVAHKKIASVAVMPAQASLAPNTLQWFRAVALDDKGKLVNGRQDIHWSVDALAGQIVDVDAKQGAAQVRTGSRPGTYANAVSAIVNQDGVGYASLEVTGAAVEIFSVTITPAVDTATVGDKRLYTASVTDELGGTAPVANVSWEISPTLGVIESSGPFTALVKMGSTPNFYPDSIVASAAGATSGSASVVLQAGPPAVVIVSPASAVIPINTTQIFTAAVFDRFGNPLDLGVTWLAKEGVATLDSVTSNSAVLRAGTKAGVFPDGLRAVQSGAEGVAAITIPAGPPTGITLTASPSSIKTNGEDSSVVTAQVVDAHGNPTGAGAQINMTIDTCTGTCSLLPGAGVADAQGRFASTLRSTYTSATQVLSSQINVSAVMKAGATTASASTTIAGTFTPAKSFLALLSRGYPLNNHTSCTALRVTPPASVIQPPSQAFNLYRFTAASSSYSVALNNYTSTGQLLLYRINADRCATNGTISVTFVRSSPIATGSSQITLSNLFVGGVDYLLAVQTTGATSNVPYRIDITP